MLLVSALTAADDLIDSAKATMVLQQLGSRINAAFRDYVDRANRFDEKALDAVLKEICSALLSSDVNVKLVAKLRERVKAKVLPALQASQNVSGQGVTSRERQLLQKVSTIAGYLTVADVIAVGRL